MNILGIRVDALDEQGVIARVDQMLKEFSPGYVCVCNVQSTTLARTQPGYREAMNGADLVTPDGAPIAWGMQCLGHLRQRRVDGPGLMLKLCALAEEKGYCVYLCGSTHVVLEELAHKLAELFPRLPIAGAHSPPFRVLTKAEDDEIIHMIEESGARLVFVGLGAPKQEIWMSRHTQRLNAVMVGVGAAFDFHSGGLKRAPAWMQRCGLEWSYRLLQQPSRLWRRYLLGNPVFVARFLLQLLSGKGATTGGVE